MHLHSSSVRTSFAVLSLNTNTSVQAVKFDLSSNLILTSSSSLEPIIAEKRVQSSSAKVFKAQVSDTQVTHTFLSKAPRDPYCHQNS